MKALSIRQPWAWLIVHGHKDIENRAWATHTRGEILIHAGQKFDFDSVRQPHMWRAAMRQRWVISPMFSYGEQRIAIPIGEIYLGGFVGRATVVDCVSESESPWFVGPYGLMLANARPVPFVPYAGKLGIFEVADDVLDNPPVIRRAEQRRLWEEKYD